MQQKKIQTTKLTYLCLSILIYSGYVNNAGLPQLSEIKYYKKRKRSKKTMPID